MNALLVLIPVTLALVVLAVGVFFWAVRHDQFEDLDSPKILPLLDEAPEVLGEDPVPAVPSAGPRSRRPG